MARAREELEAVAAELGRQAPAALPVPVDLADASALEIAASEVLERFVRIDVLVHATGTDAPGPVAELHTTGWDRVLAVNLRAGFLLAKLAWPGMERAGGGTIVLVSSVAGRRGWANAGAYCASKFALTGAGPGVTVPQ